MKGQYTARLLHEVAELETPATLDLWPAIRAQIEVAHRIQRKQEHRQSSWGAALRANLRPSIAICLVVLVLAIGLPVTVIAAQALPHGWQQRFGLVLINATPSPIATAMAQSHAAPVARVAQASPWISLDEAQRQVPFPIRVPAWLPAGLALRGVLVGSDGAVNSEPGAVKVILSYSATDGSSKGLHIDQVAGSAAGGLAVPAGQEQTAVVNGRPAVYMHGAWRKDETWDATADSGILSWEAGGFTYLIQYSGLGLTREDLIRIAESLH